MEYFAEDAQRQFNEAETNDDAELKAKSASKDFEQFLTDGFHKLNTFRALLTDKKKRYDSVVSSELPPGYKKEVEKATARLKKEAEAFAKLIKKL